MNFVLILAGGTGSRAGGPLPKQFQKVGGKRMLWWSVEAFRAFDPHCRIVLVVHPDFIERWDDELGIEESMFGSDIIKAAGGGSRIESVKNGLQAIEGLNPVERDKVYIHDSARPFVTPELILRGTQIVEKGKGAVPVIPLTDSIRLKTATGSKAVNREDYAIVQTPQIFMWPDIAEAYGKVRNEALFTDDASIAEHNGIEILTFDGDPANIKITNPSDFNLFNK